METECINPSKSYYNSVEGVLRYTVTHTNTLNTIKATGIKAMGKNKLGLPLQATTI